VTAPTEVITCSECGNEETLRWNEDANQYLRSTGLCFNCGFWLEKLIWAASGDRTDEGQRVARINHNHYVIKPDTSSWWKGFGGAGYYIRFNSGDEVLTHNLWHQGEIPERFRDQLPDNAEWIDRWVR
jgi:hypothetical protein